MYKVLMARVNKALYKSLQTRTVRTEKHCCMSETLENFTVIYESPQADQDAELCNVCVSDSLLLYTAR